MCDARTRIEHFPAAMTTLTFEGPQEVGAGQHVTCLLEHSEEFEVLGLSSFEAD